MVATIAAGLFGIVHDQISYTVAPEYFTKFKFRQFGFTDLPLPERTRAAMVGFLASWWMGIPIGLLVGAAGFIHNGPRRMLMVSSWSLLVTIGFTLLVGLTGLIYGYFQTAHIDLANYDGWFIPTDVSNLRRFLCAGYMHNASYLGGVLAIPVAWVFHVIMKRRVGPDAKRGVGRPRPLEFSPRAQQALALARKEAVRLNHEFVGTEHLLLGLINLRQGGGVDLLQKLGVNLDSIKAELERIALPGSGEPITGNRPYTPRVKNILNLAQKHAVMMAHRQVGTKHLVLGILQEGDGLAARVLKQSGLTFDLVWKEIRSNDPGHRL